MRNKKHLSSKMSRLLVLLVNVILLSSIFSFAIAAEANETAIDTSQFTLTFDAGTTPDSAFMSFFDHFAEGVQDVFIFDEHSQATFDMEIAAERMAEAYALIQAGNTEDAISATEDAQSRLESASQEVETIDVSNADASGIQVTNGQAEDAELYELAQTFDHAMQLEEYNSQLNNILQEQVNSGDVTQAQAEEITANIDAGTSEVISQTEDKINEAEDAIAENSNVAGAEAEILVAKIYEDAGLNAVFETKTSEEQYDHSSEELLALKADVADLREQGNTEEARQLETLIGEAELKLSESVSAKEIGASGEAFGQLNAAEHLIGNCKRALDKLDDGDKQAFKDITAEFLRTPEEIQKEAEEKAKHFSSEEWQNFKADVIAKYPEKVEYFAAREKQAEKVSELAVKLNEVFAKKFDDLKADGKTDEEATAILSQKFTDAYSEAYGGELYMPPGFMQYKKEKKAPAEETGEIEVEVIPIGEIPKDFFERQAKEKDAKEGQEIVEFNSAFIEGYEYKDPSTDYKYEFDDNGYTYTTDLGISYDVEYPEGFTPESFYKSGDEQYSQTIKTEDGEVTYEYSATGYEVTKNGEVVEKVAYPTGTHELVGGGAIKNEATGFVVESSQGVATRYDYNPQFRNYVDPVTGKVYVPDVAIHQESTFYDSSKKEYVFSQGGETWNYQGSGSWKSSSGKEYKSNSVAAPVGYEDKKEYTTPEGVTWNFDNGQWASSNGEKYTPPVHHYYRYDAERGYVNEKGKIVSSTESVKLSPGTEGATAVTGQGQVSDYATGKSWSYDTSSNTWKSSIGEAWNPSTGQYSGGEGSSGTSGGASAGTSYSDYGKYYDSSGKSYAQVYAGGDYIKATDGAYTYVPHTAGNTIEGQYYNDYSSGNVKDNYGNTWVQGNDGTWSNQGGGTGTGPTYTNADGSGGTTSGAGSYYGSWTPGYSGAPSGSEGTYSGGSYSGGTYSGGTYSGGTTSDGSYSGGTYSGGTTSGGTTGSYSGGYTAPSGDSGGGGSYSAPSGDSGGSSGGSAPSGGDSGGGGGGGGTTGMAIADHGATQGFLSKLFKKK